MSATRTQVYFSEEQRRALDERAAAEGKSLAQVVREAVDAYLETRGDADAVNAAMDRHFATMPELDVPSRREWDRERDGR